MGYLALETLVADLQGHRSRPRVFVDVVTVTQANMNDHAIRAVLEQYTQ
jgi:ribose transport system substrate-binding protein